MRPREIHEAAAAARAGQASQQWKDRYKVRAGVEGTMAQATHVTGIRRARYLGRVADPLLSNPPRTAPYPPGSWGPARARKLIEPGRWLLGQ